MTEPIDQATKLPPLPWVYTEDKREEMFSIHTEGQDPIDCDNRFIVCGIWYQSLGRDHGKAIADFIINSVNTAEKLKQERNKVIDECIEILLDELEDTSNTRKEMRQGSSTVKRMESIKDKDYA